MTGEARAGIGANLPTQMGSDALVLPRFLSLVPQQAKALPTSLRPLAESALAVAEEALRPATRDDFRNELGARLALVAPVGMTEEDRAQWFRAAWKDLEGIPADLLRQGCAAAKWCDHHAKIVPAILTEVGLIWKRRRTNRTEVLAAIAKMETPPLAKEERCSAEQARRIIKHLKLKVDDDKPARSADWIPVEQRRAPTYAEYLAMGVSPEALAESGIEAPATPQGDRSAERQDREDGLGAEHEERRSAASGCAELQR